MVPEHHPGWEGHPSELTGEHSFSQSLPQAAGGCCLHDSEADSQPPTLSSPNPGGLERLLFPIYPPPTPALAANSLAGMSWHLTQEGRAAAEMVGEFLPLLDL